MLGDSVGRALGDADTLGFAEVLGAFDKEGFPEGNGDVLG